MTPFARGLVAFIAWSATAVILAPICFFGTILLAGPHSDVLPSVLQPAVLLLGAGGFLVAPVLVARLVWRRLSPSPLSPPPGPPAP